MGIALLRVEVNLEKLGLPVTNSYQEPLTNSCRLFLYDRCKPRNSSGRQSGHPHRTEALSLQITYFPAHQVFSLKVSHLFLGFSV